MNRRFYRRFPSAQAATATPTTTGPATVASGDLGGKIGDSLAALFSLAVGLFLWWCGAYLTLFALQSLGLPIERLRGGAWLIPICISAVEIRWWPKPATLRTYRTMMLLAVALPDLASTFYGAWQYLAGREVPLFTGFVIPEEGRALLTTCSIVSVIVTFAPEWLIVQAVKDLARLWRFNRTGG